ncbi:hypothetical protein EDB19DRAFT_13386 [Suillus lakei]|nr:hypothetical protein EDB19DRAFT_13386 [Suillus lakei]
MKCTSLLKNLLSLINVSPQVRFPSCRPVHVDLSNLDDFSYDGRRPPDFPYNPLDIPSLIVSISECFSPALETLHFDFDPEFTSFIEQGALANPGLAPGFDAVAPLLAFSRLTHLQLGCICFLIDDASLKTITQSWPQLENFGFGEAGHIPVPSSLTFVGLAHLIHHCRRLHTIEISFCAFEVDINSESFPTTIPNERIIELFVNMSPIVSPIAVASQLQRLMPKLATSGLIIIIKIDGIGPI